MTLRPSIFLASILCLVGFSNAEQQVIQISASSSGMLHASNCCTMSYMGSANASTVFMRTCQSVYMVASAAAGPPSGSSICPASPRMPPSSPHGSRGRAPRST